MRDCLFRFFLTLFYFCDSLFDAFILSLMRFTHAIVVRIPNSAKFDEKKAAKATDLSLARKQQEDLNDTLREASLTFF